MKLEKIIKITGQLVCETGLHIGGSSGEIHIGGIDNPVIKNPITQQPYIPGSSLKGKIRSLLEWRVGVIQEGPFSFEEYKNHKDKQGAILKVLKLFGVGGNSQLNAEQAQLIGPTRLSFWDCSLTEEWIKYIQEGNLLYVEGKTENMINRIKGTAEHPRQSERVPAGSTFEFNLSMKVLDIDNTDDLLKTVYQGLHLLELDSLGGSGSRGYGKVKFVNIKAEGYSGAVAFDQVKPYD